MAQVSGNRTLSGTWGEIWIDGEKIFEMSKVEMKVIANREDVQLGLDVDSKITGLKGEFSITIKRVYSSYLDVYDDWKNGMDKRVQIITKLGDPDSVDGQIERYSAEDCWFNELPLVSYEKGGNIEQEVSGGFPPTKMINIDKIA